MSTMPGPSPVTGAVGRAACDAAGSRIWPVGTRRVLAATVIAAALGLAVGSAGVDPAPDAGLPVARTLKLDPNTAPSQVLGVLPQFGPALVRELVSARNERPLTSLEDARSRVRGLGPAISDQIAPYLEFKPAAGSRPDQVTSSPGDRTVKKPRATKRKKPRSQPPAPAPTHLVAQSTVPGVE